MIECVELTKAYPIGPRKRTVLDRINVTFEPGVRVGILGRNGEGKSTLIKLVGGAELPTSGRIVRKMSTSWPLGFGGGFQGSLTGLDNARFIARIYGKAYSEIRRFVEDFSELGDQLKMPVKTYSSGMRARLAFGLSLAIEFDSYLVDEIILVGDQNFQRKCHTELFEKRADRAMLLASHDVGIIREVCQQILVVNGGQTRLYNDVEEGIDIYNQL